jgi:hypothetical protein
MRTSDNDFPFGPNFNFGTNNLLNATNNEEGTPFPVPSGAMLLLDNTHMLLLDGTDMLLL